MFVEEPEAFKVWLTTILKPMCDADPAALAKYIIALVKKDKSTSALRESMVNQLEVFLQGETESFVNLLFKTLETQEYLTPIIPSTNPPNPHVDIDTSTRNIATNVVSKDQSKPVVPVIPASELPSLIETINNGTKKEKEKDEPIQRKEYIKKNDAERDDKPLTSSTSSLASGSLPTNRRRSRHRSMSRERNRNMSRSRSRSWDRCRRQNSRSPPSQSTNIEQSASSANTSGNKPPTSSHSHHHHSSASLGIGARSGGGDKGDRGDRRGDRGGRSGGSGGVWRNKSPPPRRYGGDRRGRGGSQSPPPGREQGGNRKSRSRSPTRHSNYRSNRYRNRSPPPIPHRSPASRSRSRERIPPPAPSTINPPGLVGVVGGTSTPTQDSSHGDMDLRLSNAAQSIKSVVAAAVAVAAAAAGGAAIVAPPGTTGGPIIGGTGKRRCRDYDEKGYCMRGEMCPYDHGIDPVVVEDTTLSQVLAYAGSSSTVSQQVNGPIILPSVDGPPPNHHPGLHALAGLHPPHPLTRLPPPPLVGNVPPPPPEYNPQAPQIWRGPPQMGVLGGPPLMGNIGQIGYGPPPCPPGALPPPPTNQPPPVHQQRELISIPTTIDPQQLHKQLPPIGAQQQHLLSGLNHHHHLKVQHSTSIGYNNQQQLMHHHHMHHVTTQHGVRPQYGAGLNAGIFKRKTFDYNRLGPRRLGAIGGVGGLNCALELKKVPVGMNNITHLNNHFGKFGKIVNIQVSFEGDPEAAIVTFSSHAEANAAYRSTEAVLNNRFIKVFWHSPDGVTTNKSTNDSTAPNRGIVASVKDRLGTTSNNMQQHQNKVLNLVNNATSSSPTTASSNLSTTQTGKAVGSSDGTIAPAGSSVAEKENNIRPRDDKETTGNDECSSQKVKEQAVAVAAIKRGQELLAAKEKLKKNQEEKRREAIKLTQDLRKRKQELLEKQLAQQKLLIDKMEKAPAGVQRDKLLETIKKSQESIEAIRKDMMAQQQVTATSKLVTPSQIAKSKEEVQKEMLDAELDLITKQQEGVDTSDVQKRLKDLQVRQRALMAMKSNYHKTAKRYNPLQVNRTLLTKNNLIGDANSLLKGNVKKSALNNHLPQQQQKQKHAIDHRPTRLLVSGYENDEIDSVLTYFKQFGEITDHQSDPSTPHVILNYRFRKEAEQALLRGKHFQDRTLSVTWCLTPPPSTHTALNNDQNAHNLSVPTTIATTTNTSSSIDAGGATLTAVPAQTHAKPLSGGVGTSNSGRTVLLSNSSDYNDDLESNDGNMGAIDEGVLLGLEEDRILDGGAKSGGKSGSRAVGVTEGEDELGVEMSEEVLLQDDEEEDEENEDRSWRR